MRAMSQPSKIEAKAAAVSLEQTNTRRQASAPLAHTCRSDQFDEGSVTGSPGKLTVGGDFATTEVVLFVLSIQIGLINLTPSRVSSLLTQIYHKPIRKLCTAVWHAFWLAEKEFWHWGAARAAFLLATMLALGGTGAVGRNLSCYCMPGHIALRNEAHNHAIGE